MTTSGLASYALNAAQLVEKSFHILGKASEGEALTPRMYSDGMSSLNLLLKTIGAQEHLWIKTERSVTLVADTAAYVLTPKPGRVLSVRRRQVYGSNTTDVPMNEMARSDYFDQPTKTTSPSTPVSWYYDPQTTTGTLYLWPAPIASIIATQSLQITYLRRIQDMVTTTDDLDMPQEWLQTVAWMLANDLETEYPVNDPRLAGKIERRATQLFQALKGWDTEPASIYLQADDYPGYGYYR
jgi:hypothetical protein